MKLTFFIFSFFLNTIFFIFSLFTFDSSSILLSTLNQKGQKNFLLNCSACHIGGNNIIIPEKNLKKDALQTNGMDNKNAIMYQIINGKNGMPAFGGRLTEQEIEDIANYILEESF
jgi:cytochrome c6